MTPAARNGWIDVLRALSALAVGLFHFNTVPSTLPPGTIAQGWRNLWSHGHWGIGVFFALSGYCLFPGWSRAVGGLDFLRRRARRIFPPYWSSLLLIALLALGVKLVTGVNDVAKLPSNAGAVAATVLLMTDPVTAIPTINWVYWTLSGTASFASGISFSIPHRSAPFSSSGPGPSSALAWPWRSGNGNAGAARSCW